MQCFKGKRQILFKQLDSAFRGPARDHRGHFRSKRAANADANTGDRSSALRLTQVSKKSKKMDAIETYSPNFIAVFSCRLVAVVGLRYHCIFIFVF